MALIIAYLLYFQNIYLENIHCMVSLSSYAYKSEMDLKVEIIQSEQSSSESS